MSTVNVDIVTPERLCCSTQANLVTVPGEEGYMGILPNHSPLISNLQSGIVEINISGASKERYFVAEGLVEVSPERCTVLTKKALDVTKLSSSDVATMVADKKASLEQAYKQEDIQKLESDLAFLEELSDVFARIAA